jgi:hypothetical protein
MKRGAVKNSKAAKASVILPRKNYRGQVTIFIIIGIIIVALGLLAYSFYPQIKSTIGAGEKSPQGYIQSCIENDIQNAITKVSLQGGSITPDNYVLYKNNKVQYLCYTDEYYCSPSGCCVVQQPMLKQHIESEIKNAISSNVDSCFNSMKTSYQKQGYDVNLAAGDKKVELLPKRVVATFNYSLTLTKGSTQKYDSFSVVLDNNLYELTSIANSIIEWETTYGNADPTIYMSYYPDLKVEKSLRGSGDKVYILTDRNIGNKFEFASKSQVWPAGYYFNANANTT